MAQKKVSIGSVGPFLYNDATTASAVTSDGSLSTDQITLGSDPTASMHAVTKQYADSLGGISEVHGLMPHSNIGAATDPGNGLFLSGGNPGFVNNGRVNFTTAAPWGIGTWNGANDWWTGFTLDKAWNGFEEQTFTRPKTNTTYTAVNGYAYNDTNVTIVVGIYLAYATTADPTVLKIIKISGGGFFGGSATVATNSQASFVTPAPSNVSVPAHSFVVMLCSCFVASGSLSAAGGIHFRVQIN